MNESPGWKTLPFDQVADVGDRGADEGMDQCVQAAERGDREPGRIERFTRADRGHLVAEFGE